LLQGDDCGVKRHFQQHSSYVVAISFINGGKPEFLEKTPACHKSLTKFIA
jgi:hypothetical protein